MAFTTRPELSGTFGMVASTHWLASAAGMAVLERGGNAFDAWCLMLRDFGTWERADVLEAAIGYAGGGDPATLERLFPHSAPVVTLLDGHPHTLSFIGDACLGVQRFGQSGDLAELYEHHAIDAESVVGTALDLMG